MIPAASQRWSRTCPGDPFRASRRAAHNLGVQAARTTCAAPSAAIVVPHVRTQR